MFLAHYPKGNNFKISTFEIDEEKFSEISDEFQTKYLEIETQLKEKVKIKVEKTIFFKYLSQAIELTDKSLLVINIFQDELYGFWFEIFSENHSHKIFYFQDLL